MALERLQRYDATTNQSAIWSSGPYSKEPQEGQDKIYFVTGEGRRAAEIAPAMEKMRLKEQRVVEHTMSRSLDSS